MKYIFGLMLISLFSLSAMACPDDQLCAGDRVIDSNNDIGSIVEVLKGGEVYIDWDKPSYVNTTTSTDKLAFAITCLGKLRNGYGIIDNNGAEGIVVEMFTNGKVHVDWNKASDDNSVTTIGRVGHKLEACAQ